MSDDVPTIAQQTSDLYNLANTLPRYSDKEWRERAHAFTLAAMPKLPPAARDWDLSPKSEASFVTATCHYLLQAGVPYETVKLAIIFHFSE